MSWKMSEKLKAKSKNRFSSLFSKSTVPNTNTTPGHPSGRRNSMPASRAAHFPTSPIPSSSYFRPKSSTPISSSAGIRPRTVSSPSTISTPPSVRLRIPQRSTSPNGAPTQRRRHTGLSARERRRANERRGVTLESEKCRAELSRGGTVVRDFQAEHDAEEHRRMLASRARESSHHREFYARLSSEDDETVVRGRKHDRGRHSADSLAVAVHALAA